MCIDSYSDRMWQQWAARQYSTVPASSMVSSSETTVSEMIASTTATSSEAAVTGTPADFPDASQIAEEMG